MNNHFAEVNNVGTQELLPGQFMKKKSMIDNQMNNVNVLDGRNYEYPKSIKVEVFDPLGRSSVVEENLKLVFRKLNSKGVSCNFSVGSSQNKMFMDQINEMVLFVNDKHALTNKDRFRLDRNNTDADLEAIAEFFLRTFDVACFYRF